jgi:hypothetical protein
VELRLEKAVEVMSRLPGGKEEGHGVVDHLSLIFSFPESFHEIVARLSLPSATFASNTSVNRSLGLKDMSWQVFNPSLLGRRRYLSGLDFG